jgi:hypothetical protein
MSNESLKTWIWLTSSLTASSNPAIKASYSASLLDARNSNRRAYVTSFPSGSVRMRPAPEPSFLDAPSMYSVHIGVFLSALGFEVVAPLCSLGESFLGVSAMKSAITCPLITDRGLYVILCSPSSIAYLANRPDFSGLSNTCLIGWSVRTHIA